MLYRQKRRLYSQNFLRDPELIQKLIRMSSLSPNDTVVEIGPGKGIITRELINTVARVIAVEKDERLFRYLTFNFNKYKNARFYSMDYLLFKPTGYFYKVFSNIPFSITADIMRKLTQDNLFLEGFLIMQKEAAKKFIGMPLASRNSMMSVLLKPWFDTEILWSFKETDFIPIPKVDIVMLHIKRKYIPDIKLSDKNLYRAFMKVLFNREKVSKKDYMFLTRRFYRFKKYADKHEIERLFSEAKNIDEQTGGLVKIHWTRWHRRFAEKTSRTV